MNFTEMLSYNSMVLIVFAFVVHLFFCIRFTVKAVQGDIDNYNFGKMALVFLLPVIGYFWVMKEQKAAEELI